MQALGRQVLVEFYDCDKNILNNAKSIESFMVEAVKASKATIVKYTFHTFAPHGVSGVIVIAESHVAIHTWPEYGYAAVDIFTCGETIDPWIIHHFLKDAFKSQNSSSMELKRGLFNSKQKIYHKPVGLTEST